MNHAYAPTSWAAAPAEIPDLIGSLATFCLQPTSLVSVFSPSSTHLHACLIQTVCRPPSCECPHNRYAYTLELARNLCTKSYGKGYARHPAFGVPNVIFKTLSAVSTQMQSRLCVPALFFSIVVTGQLISTIGRIGRPVDLLILRHFNTRVNLASSCPRSAHRLAGH